MKKIIALMMCALMVFCAVVAISAADEKVATFTNTATKAELKRGETVVVTVALSNCDVVKSVQLAVDVDENVFEVVSGTDIGMLKEKKYLASFKLGTNKLNATMEEDTAISGDVFTFTLKVKDDAAFGKTSVTVVPKVTVKQAAGGVETTIASTAVAAEVAVVCDHNWTVTGTVAPTCKEPGATNYACSVCNETKSEPIAIDANAHAWGEATTVAPTCTAAGYTQRVCALCGAIEKTNEVAALGHEFGTDVTVVTAATCGADGVGTVKCVRCDATQEVVIPATGNHTPADETVDVDATCTEDGFKGAILCTVCGQLTNADDVETVPALGHDWVKGETVAPTETEEGYTEYKCSVCGETKKDDFVPALGAKDTDKTDDTTKAPADSSKPADDKKPAMGDSMIFAVVLLAVVACASATIIVVRRRKTSK